MRLISTEIDEAGIQLTYTDGRVVPEAQEYLIYRRPFDGDQYKSLAWNQLRVMSALAQWAEEERRRIRNEIEKNM